MSQLNVPQNFYVNLLELLLKFKHRVIIISEASGLTSMQAITLLLTDQDTMKPMGNFCRLFGCDASNMTGIVDGLEQKKLVVRSEHPSDRRVKVITLLPKGIKIKAEILSKINQTNDSFFANLTETEMQQLVAIVAKLSVNE